jgi:hypothetical protein
MLVPYRKDYRKIILGILSFIPGLHDYDRVAEEVDWSLGVVIQSIYGKMMRMAILAARRLLN